MHILIVDDNLTNLKLLRVTLEGEGVTVIEATNGIEALKTLAVETVDAVITDVLMPLMDGYRLCFELRKIKRLELLPVIIYTASYTSAKDEKLSMDMGATLYLRKPVPPKAIMKALYEVIHTAPLERPKPISPPEELDLMKDYNERLVKKLETTHAELTHLLAHSPAVMYKLRNDGGGLSPCVVSENIERLLGVRLEETRRPGWWQESLCEEDRERVLEGLAQGLHAGGCTLEYRLLHQDGSYRWVEDNNRVVRAEAGQPTEVVGVWSDITKRRQAEGALKESEGRYRETAGRLSALLDSSLDMICTLDREGCFLQVNAACLPMLGYTPQELLGTLYIAKVHEADQMRTLEEAAAVIEGRISRNFENRYVRKDEELATLEWSAQWSEVDQVMSCVARDITLHKKLEQQFLRAQRMESIGTLAGGIAHDLNNVLSPIMMSIDLLKMGETDPQRLGILRTIEGSTKRGADMVGQVLSFARGMEGQQVEVQLRPLLEEVEKIANETFLKHIEVVVNSQEDLWTVQGDPTQLHQVLINLCVNARDAMPDGGTLTLTAGNLELDAHYAAMNLEAQVGPHVVLQVEDTGGGMTPGVQERVFEPFYTTKELGKGTGLGLSTTLAIIKSHGGFVRVYSEKGKGTRFDIYLPAQTRSGDEPAGVRTEALPRGNGELVLLVDDEAAVRQITRQTLEAFGYRVLLAADGAEATAYFAMRNAEIAVVLTDMMMPVMDGPTMIPVLMRINPEVRIIAASGLNANGMVARAANAGVKHFIPKPYTAETLLKTLRTVLA
ncbi:response regulator [Prosthecobacter sp. SYSU 5D2]|uniref:hybrid sensor histidine kinase/response regulator n=1 Tax=Prosthecobacter sp. SYSU 5D2 TaxID=3134134 RepID=UPI0031FE5F2D